MNTFAITSNRKTETFDINGGITVQAGLALFLRCAERDVERSLDGQVVRLNANTIPAAQFGTTAVRPNDFITIVAAEVARGGVKGAV